MNTFNDIIDYLILHNSDVASLDDVSLFVSKLGGKSTELTANEIEVLFNEIDDDETGGLDREQVPQLLQSLAEHSNVSEEDFVISFKENIASDLYSQCCSGQLSISEFRNICSQIPMHDEFPRSLRLKLIREIPSSPEGFISREDFVKTLPKLTVGLSISSVIAACFKYNTLTRRGSNPSDSHHLSDDPIWGLKCLVKSLPNNEQEEHQRTQERLDHESLHQKVDQLSEELLQSNNLVDRCRNKTINIARQLQMGTMEAADAADALSQFVAWQRWKFVLREVSPSRVRTSTAGEVCSSPAQTSPSDVEVSLKSQVDALTDELNLLKNQTATTSKEIPRTEWCASSNPSQGSENLTNSPVKEPNNFADQLRETKQRLEDMYEFYVSNEIYKLEDVRAADLLPEELQERVSKLDARCRWKKAIGITKACVRVKTGGEKGTKKKLLQNSSFNSIIDGGELLKYEEEIRSLKSLLKGIRSELDTVTAEKKILLRATGTPDVTLRYNRLLVDVEKMLRLLTENMAMVKGGAPLVTITPVLAAQLQKVTSSVRISRTADQSLDTKIVKKKPKPKPVAPYKVRNRLANVRHFGAAGDGLTDDSRAVQNAIQAAGRNGADVYFPQGHYVLHEYD